MAQQHVAEIERMLVELGAESSITQVGHKPSGKQKLLNKVQHKDVEKNDCLAGGQRSGFSESPSISKRSPSPVRPGASIAGKSSATKRYFGSGFVQPSTASPGPIYQAPSEFGAAGRSGQSFSRSQRMSSLGNSTTPAPCAYDVPSTVGGKQLTTRSAPSAKFSPPGKNNDRFKNNQFISREHSKQSQSTVSPSPAAYFDRENAKKLSTLSTQATSFSGSRNDSAKKVFISRAHVADVLGQNSPGPAYDVSTSATHASGPSFSFGLSFRSQEKESLPLDTEITSAVATCTVSNENGKFKRTCIHASAKKDGVYRHTPQQMFISREHCRSQGNADTPGPAYYTPDGIKTMNTGPRAVIPRHSGVDKRFFSKELSTMKGTESPGPMYNPRSESVMERAPKCSFGVHNPAEGAMRDRFENKTHLGKGIGETPGNHSPGPLYDQPALSSGYAYTMGAREREVAKQVCPAPNRVRFISRELAKDNLGAFSPGPAYFPKDVSKSAPAYSFGTSEREWGHDITEDHREKLGTAEKPYTCPGDARFISPDHSRTTMAGKGSPGPAKFHPDDKFSSTHPRPPVARINPANPSQSRKKKEDSEEKGPLLNPSDKVCHKDEPAFAFGKSKRPPLSQPTAAPGPMQYSIKHSLVEKKVPGASFGGLN